MIQARHRAFTIVELLVVILAVALLLALLVPGLSTAWEAADTARCKTNLAAIYKAQGVWTADHMTSRMSYTSSGGWAAALLAYLDNCDVVLTCPACARRAADFLTGGTSGKTSEAKKKGLRFPHLELSDIAIGVYDKNRNFQYDMPLSGSPHYRIFKVADLGSNRKRFAMNNDDPRETDEDMVMEIEFRDGHPVRLTIGVCDASIDQWTDLRICGKAIWSGEMFHTVFAQGHFGETVDLEKEAYGNSGDNWASYAASVVAFGETNYGVSRGACQNPRGQSLYKPDAKLFFVLDYPKPVADYSHLEADDAWWQFFILDPASWTPPPEFETCPWQEVQALRHGGRANVLFCDGHIETLGVDPESADGLEHGAYLRGDSPLWHATGW